jgi:hypothetical protein
MTRRTSWTYAQKKYRQSLIQSVLEYTEAEYPVCAGEENIVE